MNDQEKEILVDNAKILKEFTEYLVSAMLGDVTILHRVNMQITESRDCILECIIDPKYVGRCIGREGKCANAIRELVRRKGKMMGDLKASVDIIALGAGSYGRQPRTKEERDVGDVIS